ncbi:MAG: hypothetical protein ACJARO_000330, partial [Bacteriovoracaceae bacterium]
MNDIITYLISPQRPTEDPGFKYSWYQSIKEVRDCLISNPTDCFIIDYSQVDHGFHFDKDLFLKEARDFSSVQGLAFKINKGEPLISLGPDFKMLKEEASPNDIHRDGLVRVPLYYLSKVASLDFITDQGVQIPLLNYGL